MTEENSKLLSLDVGYLIFAVLLIFNYLAAKDILDLLFLVVTTIYYLRVKIYRWKKYH